MVLAERRLTIVEAIGILHGSLVWILNYHQGMRKLSVRQVTRLLTIDVNRVKDVLVFIKRKHELTTAQLITNSSPNNTNKVMTTMNGEQYANLLDWLKDDMEKKRQHLATYIRSQSLRGKFNKLCNELHPYPQYFPDLITCDYFRFLNKRLGLILLLGRS